MTISTILIAYVIVVGLFILGGIFGWITKAFAIRGIIGVSVLGAIIALIIYLA